MAKVTIKSKKFNLKAGKTANTSLANKAGKKLIENTLSAKEYSKLSWSGKRQYKRGRKELKNLVNSEAAQKKMRDALIAGTANNLITQTGANRAADIATRNNGSKTIIVQGQAQGNPNNPNNVDIQSKSELPDTTSQNVADFIKW